MSVLGSRISRLALPFLALELTGSASLTATILAVSDLVYLALGLPAGVIADRFERRRLMIACELTRALAVGFVPLAYMLGCLRVEYLYFVFALQAIAEVLFGCAMLASVPRLVPAGMLSDAYGASGAVEAGCAVAGPGVSGTLIGLARTTAAGAGLAFLIDSISYFVSAFSLACVRQPLGGGASTASTKGVRSVWRDIGDGLRFLWHERRIRFLAVTVGMTNLLVSPVSLAVIVHAERDLGSSAGSIGLVFSCMAGAGFVASLFAGRIGRALPLRIVIGGGIAAIACGTAVIASSGSIEVVAAGVMINSFAATTFNVNQVAFRTSLIPDAMQGRVQGAFRSIAVGLGFVGTIVGGLAIDAFGPTVPLFAAGAGVALVALSALVRFPARTAA